MKLVTPAFGLISGVGTSLARESLLPDLRLIQNWRAIKF